MGPSVGVGERHVQTVWFGADGNALVRDPIPLYRVPRALTHRRGGS